MMFSGAKLAVLSAGHVLAFLRDMKPGIVYPGLWDLPGGGRETGESPLDCALRECWEEAGLRLRPADVVWSREYIRPGAGATWFFVAQPGWLCLPPPRLGSEGREVRWMKLAEFLGRDDAIAHLQARLQAYLQEAKAA
ncbi:MAG: NUDIX domain-containing protein [Rhodobacteraceae bacterium]|nr:NUDIX domain-containing protein [Paracoccaceae bacterium]